MAALGVGHVEHLDPVTRECLRQALEGCRVSQMALEDRLFELDLLAGWTWARERGKDVYISSLPDHCWWFMEGTHPRTEYSNSLPAETFEVWKKSRGEGPWEREDSRGYRVEFVTREEAWAWLIEQWGRWDSWPPFTGEQKKRWPSIQ